MPLHRWFDGGSLTVSDWYCPGAALGTGAEEARTAWEISLGRVGSHAVRTTEGESVLDPTRLLCLNAGEPFRPVRRVLGLDQRTRITLSPEAMRDLLGTGAEAPRFPHRTAPLTARAALAHHRLLLHVQAPARDELAIHTLALELAAHALRGAAPTPASMSTPAPHVRAARAARAAVHAVQELLARRFAEPLTLAALAAAVELSPWHLSRSFRAHTGLGLHSYRTRLRLLAALARLRDTRRPDLSRIAFEVGFSSHSHLTREFRAFFGAPPSRLAAAG